MGNKLVRSGLIFLLLNLAGCSKNSDGVCISGVGKESSEIRTLPAFSSVEVHNNLDIEYYPVDTNFRVELTGGENLLKGCVATVENGLLTIDNKNRCNWLRDYKKRVTMKVYGPVIDTLTFYGGRNFTLMDTMKTDVFTFLGWDCSGDVDLKIKASSGVYIKLNTGTSDIYLHGEAPFLYYYSLTQGFIYGRDFVCQDAQVVQDGYGDFYISPSGKLSGEIKKYGNVYYPGNIETDVKITGKGALLEFVN